MSSFFKLHKDELEKMAAFYEEGTNLELQYRAKCIRELLKQEGVKND